MLSNLFLGVNLQPHLENKLLQIRPLEERDFDDLYNVAKDPLIWEQHPSSDRYQLPVFTEFFNQSIDSQGALLVINKASGVAIGSSRYNTVVGRDDAIEIGWSFLARKYWGGRYNQSMKQLMIEHALAHVQSVLFVIGKENIRSQKAVEKIGGIIIPISELDPSVEKYQINLVYEVNQSNWSKFLNN